MKRQASRLKTSCELLNGTSMNPCEWYNVEMGKKVGFV